MSKINKKDARKKLRHIGRSTVTINYKLEQEFREIADIEFKQKKLITKGHYQMAYEEAMEDWINKKKLERRNV